LVLETYGMIKYELFLFNLDVFNINSDTY